MNPLVRRLALVPLTLLGVTLLTFLLVHLAPGDPAELRAGAGVTPQVLAEDRALVGLDRPLPARYLAWLERSSVLDFGVSLGDGRPVRARIAEALPRTAAIAALALALALLVAVPLGAAAAARDGTRGARALEVTLALAYGFPVIALALLLLRAGAPFGRSGVAGVLAPAACLALPSAIVLSRHQREALLQALAADHVRAARARGASPARVLLVHALRGALLPMVTLAGTQAPALLSGAVLVEHVFGVPGLGQLAHDAVLARDYPMLMGLSTLAAALAIASTLAADAAYLLVDPRLRPWLRPRRRREV